MDDLPRKLKKKEADKTPAIMAWFSENMNGDCAVEIKHGENKLKDHQEAALSQVVKGTFIWKIPDMGRRNPFDFVMLKRARAFVVTITGRQCIAVEKNTENVYKFNI